MLKPKYNPDVLSCLANLSNDEVFTPPDLANAMLDTLPKEIWQDENASFLDPCCKSGVFLREIAKRLLVGLKVKIPDEQKRIDHIFKNQLFGISITEMTGMLSRRSVYCLILPLSNVFILNSGPLVSRSMASGTFFFSLRFLSIAIFFAWS